MRKITEIKYLYTDHKDDPVYEVIFNDYDVEVVEVTDGTVFPTTILSKEEQKQVVHYHYYRT